MFQALHQSVACMRLSQLYALIRSVVRIYCICFRRYFPSCKRCSHGRSYSTGNPSSSCEMISLRNNSHGGIIRVCMGIFTTALRNKTIRQILNKKNLTLLPQRITCYLTAYFDEKIPFQRVVHFEVFNVHKISPRLNTPLPNVRFEKRKILAQNFNSLQTQSSPCNRC